MLLMMFFPLLVFIKKYITTDLDIQKEETRIAVVKEGNERENKKVETETTPQIGSEFDSKYHSRGVESARQVGDAYKDFHGCR